MIARTATSVFCEPPLLRMEWRRITTLSIMNFLVAQLTKRSLPNAERDADVFIALYNGFNCKLATELAARASRAPGPWGGLVYHRAFE